MRANCQRLALRDMSLLACLLGFSVVLWNLTAVSSTAQQVPPRKAPRTLPLPSRARMRIGAPGERVGGSLTFSPDGAVLVTVGARTDLWDVASGGHLRELSPRPFGFPPYRNSVQFSRDGRTILMAASDKTLASWDVATGKKVSTIFSLDADKCIESFLFLPVGDQFVLETGLVEGTKAKDAALIHQLQLWDLVQGKLLRPFQKVAYHKGGDGAYFGRLAVTPDGKTVAAADQSGTIVLWDVATGDIRREIRTTNWRLSVGTIAFSADSQSLLSTDCRATGGVGRMSWSQDDDRMLCLRIRDVASGNERFSIHGGHGRFTISEEGSFTMSLDGRLVAVANGVDSIGLYELLTWGELLRLKSKDCYSQQNLAFSPDCKSIASTMCHEYEDYMIHRDNYVLIWDLAPTEWRPATAQLSDDKLRMLWDALASENVPRAYRAVWTLSSRPAETLPFLRERLRPVATEKPERIRQLVSDLDDSSFKRRTAASEELARLGPQAKDALRRALADSPPPEFRLRAEPLLKALDSWVIKDPEQIRIVRAIWVLQRIGSPEARALLEKLAAGAPAVRQTQEAKAALQYLDRSKNR